VAKKTPNYPPKFEFLVHTPMIFGAAMVNLSLYLYLEGKPTKLVLLSFLASLPLALPYAGAYLFPNTQNFTKKDWERLTITREVNVCIPLLFSGYSFLAGNWIPTNGARAFYLVVVIFALLYFVSTLFRINKTKKNPKDPLELL